MLSDTGAQSEKETAGAITVYIFCNKYDPGMPSDLPIYRILWQKVYKLDQSFKTLSWVVIIAYDTSEFGNADQILSNNIKSQLAQNVDIHSIINVRLFYLH